VTEPTNGGAECGPLTQTTTCSVDCVLSDWLDTTPCDAATGTKTQEREVVTQPLNQGAACGPLTQTTTCSVDCVLSDWADASTCDSATGTKTQERTVVTPVRNGGVPCDVLTRTTTCRVDCVLSDWADASACASATGTKTQERTVVIAARNGGTPCEVLTRTTTCSVDCAMSDWADTSSCDSATGTKTQEREVVTQPLNQGAACGPLTRTTTCSVDCVLSDWVDTSTCASATGTKTQERAVLTAARNGGTPCGELTRTTTCNVDCVLSDWVDTSACSYLATKTQARTIVTQPRNQGAPCDALTRTTDCIAPTCTDGVKNGIETDIDCGGGSLCPACEAGKACALPGDCASRVCTDGICIPRYFDRFSTTWLPADAKAGTIAGTVDLQNGWTTRDAFTSPTIGTWDQQVVQVNDVNGNRKALRMSNAITSTGYTSQVFSATSDQVAGETNAALWNDRGTYGPTPISPPRYGAYATTDTFYCKVAFRSATGAAQPGLLVVLSPSAHQSAVRMSWVQIIDTGSGFDIAFQDATFAKVTIASGLSYTDLHTLEIGITFVDGVIPGAGTDVTGNDVVKIWLNGNLIHTGTTWEAYYYRYERITATEPRLQAVDAMLFRLASPTTGTTGGLAAVSGAGFYFDDFAIGNTIPAA
jgi:hypothetical protein